MATPLKEIVHVGPAPAAPYSRAVKAGGFIYLSGQLAQDSRGGIAGRGDVAAQTRRTIEGIRPVLAAAGSSLDDVVAVTAYITSAEAFSAMNEAYRSYWPEAPPTRTTVVTGLVVPDASIELSMVAVPAGTERRLVHPAGWVPSPSPYSYAIRSGQTLFLSGLVPRRGRDNATVRGDVRVQTQAVLENAAELLGAAGMTAADIVSARVYLTAHHDVAGMNEAYRSYFPGAPPARATVVCGLAGPDFLVEMTFTASSADRVACGTPPPGVPLSAAIRAGQHLYISGVLGATPEAAGDVAAQTRVALGRLRGTLEESGAAPSHVVDTTVFLTDAQAFTAMNEQYRSFFGDSFPARTTVVTPLVVPGGLVEIMATAVLP